MDDDDPLTAIDRLVAETHRFTGKYLESKGVPHDDLWTLARRVVWQYQQSSTDYDGKLFSAITALAKYVGNPASEDEI